MAWIHIKVMTMTHGTEEEHTGDICVILLKKKQSGKC